MTGNPVSGQAEARFLMVARLLGEEHGAAGMTPYVHAGHYLDGPGRTPAGYTRHIEDGDGIAEFASGLRIPQPGYTGRWSAGHDAMWRIAREYIRAYDRAREQGGGLAPVTPARMAGWMQGAGVTGAELRAGDRGMYPAGTLADGTLVFVLDAGPGGSGTVAARLARRGEDSDGHDHPGIPMRLPLFLAVYPPSDSGCTVPEAVSGLTPAAAAAELLHRSEVARVLADGADPFGLVAAAYVRIWAAMIIRAVDTDIARCAVPGGLTNFFELHDYVQADTYLEDAHVPYGDRLPYLETDPDGMRMAGAVADEVSRWLARRTAGGA